MYTYLHIHVCTINELHLKLSNGCVCAVAYGAALKLRVIRTSEMCLTLQNVIIVMGNTLPAVMWGDSSLLIIKRIKSFACLGSREHHPMLHTA